MPDRTVIMRRALLAGYFLGAFLLFLFLLFPYDRLKTKIEAEVRLRTPLELNMERISPRFLNRVAVSDVVLSDKTGRVLFESPALGVRVSLFSLLRGALSVRAAGPAYGGELIASLYQGRDRSDIRMDANGLRIEEYGLLKTLGLRIAGSVGGSFELSGDTGSMRVLITNVKTRELKVVGFPVPDLDFEQVWIEGDIRGDRFTIRKCEFTGKELKLNVTGDLVARERGTLNLAVKVKPSERLSREQAGLLSLLKNRDAEGFYQFSLGGTLSAPVPRL